jgi:hypothetical protein
LFLLFTAASAFGDGWVGSIILNKIYDERTCTVKAWNVQKDRMDRPVRPPLTIHRTVCTDFAHKCILRLPQNVNPLLRCDLYFRIDSKGPDLSIFEIPTRTFWKPYPW